MAPVSAFAARKAAQTSSSHISINSDTRATSLPIDFARNDGDDVLTSTRKKRKRGRQVAQLNRQIFEEDESPSHESSTPSVYPLNRDGESHSLPDKNERSSGEDDGSTSETSREEDIVPIDGRPESRRGTQIRQLSNLTPNRSHVLEETDAEWSIRIDKDDTLAILGQYELWVKKGAISISGAILHASSQIHRVYAPSTHAIPMIHPIRNPYGPEHQPAEISIRTCGSRIRLLKELSPKFRHIWNERPKANIIGHASARRFRRSFVNIQTSPDNLYPRPLGAFNPPSDWQAMIRDIPRMAAARIGIMLCGPKGSGKSTMCRMLANRILTAPGVQVQNGNTTLTEKFVAFLDLDPGQPEFSPPGELSLVEMHSCNFGVPYTHPMAESQKGDKVLRAHHIGSPSPKDDPRHYLGCILDLLNSYKRLLAVYPLCPLIINCSGWIQGSGLELLLKLIDHSMVTHVLSVYDSPGSEEYVRETTRACLERGKAYGQLSTLPCSAGISRTASELRIMQTMSYFHLREPEVGYLRWDPRPVTDMTPLVVPFAGVQQSIFAVMILGDEQSPDFFECVLDGSVVGLVVIEDDMAIPREQNKKPEIGSPGARDEPFPEELDTEDQESTYPDYRSTSEDLTDDVPQQATKHKNKFKATESNTPTHLHHPSIRRTKIGIPYLPPTHKTTSPLNPSHCHSLGQALIRSINHSTNSFYLLTPTPPPILQALHQNKRKIVLVRGRLDNPTWAYKEDLEHERSRRKRRERHHSDVKGSEEEGKEDGLEAWAAQQPWAGIGQGKRKSSSKVRRVRRDIRYKGHGGGDMSG